MNNSERGQALIEYWPTVAGMMVLVLAIIASGCVPNFAQNTLCPVLVGFNAEPSYCCNRGLGNLEEGCDPGNSTEKPGRAGENNEPSGPPGE